MEPEEATPDSNANKQTIYVIVEYKTAAPSVENNRPYTLLSAINYNRTGSMLTLPVPELQTQLQQHFFHDHYHKSTFEIYSLNNQVVSSGFSATDHLNIAMVAWQDPPDYRYGPAVVKGAVKNEATARAHVWALVNKVLGPHSKASQGSDGYVRVMVDGQNGEPPMMLHWRVEKLKYDPSSVVVEQVMYLPV
ncbi:uncharacterized protein N0V89_004471 [Didymosphaeria variabile]|uniref:Uncharacterized protein n=1 Tax=Didymosphaeria variabile TaxID=1932322 RepID=A0A9W9CD96_9PLEO|nr:uncharacterized protein N0V89_004471 [Didymosphaeria variabile]KAJ4356438.1 hypothetical protein N0V89_004471 [Didymosphaeria variabile]